MGAREGDVARCNGPRGVEGEEAATCPDEATGGVGVAVTLVHRLRHLGKFLDLLRLVLVLGLRLGLGSGLGLGLGLRLGHIVVGMLVIGAVTCWG